MLDCREEAMSAFSVVTRLSPDGSGTLEFWLRGRATSGTCSCGAGRRETRLGTIVGCRASRQAIDYNPHGGQT